LGKAKEWHLNFGQAKYSAGTMYIYAEAVKQQFVQSAENFNF